MNIEELKEKYRIYVHRKEWKELSEVEKKMFEYLVDELNADTMVAPLLATEIYEQIIEPAMLESRLELAQEMENKIGDSTCHDIGQAIRYAQLTLKRCKRAIEKLSQREEGKQE
jgi:ribonucleotide reductase beta subunit family protein with ferritin-like domain